MVRNLWRPGWRLVRRLTGEACGARNLRAGASGRARGGHGDDSSGYSGTPLPKKLGIREGSRRGGRVRAAGLRRACSARCPPGAELRTHARGRLDVIVFFVTRRAELARRFPSFARALEDDGGLWVAWPKKTSGVATDLGVRRGAAVGLDAGLVDNKVCRHRRHLVGPAVRVPRRGPGRR